MFHLQLFAFLFALPSQAVEPFDYQMRFHKHVKISPFIMAINNEYVCAEGSLSANIRTVLNHDSKWIQPRGYYQTMTVAEDTNEYYALFMQNYWVAKGNVAEGKF